MAEKKSKQSAGVIQPECLYTRQAFLDAAGISAATMRSARRRGVEPMWLCVGKKKFIYGISAIQYIVSLSELERPSLCRESPQLEPLVARQEMRHERSRIFGLRLV